MLPLRHLTCALRIKSKHVFVHKVLSDLWDYSARSQPKYQEKWHLLGADDDLQWIVLFYAVISIPQLCVVGVM